MSLLCTDLPDGEDVIEPPLIPAVTAFPTPSPTHPPAIESPSPAPLATMWQWGGDDAAVTWHDARARCLAAGGDLPVIDSHGEALAFYNWLYNTDPFIGADDHVWIGATDLAEEVLH